ncbi:MAG: hypothetical protein K9I26_05135 [Flavobacterium sp.]|nr:hypothetical protein [Flavobacterium sp.]
MKDSINQLINSNIFFSSNIAKDTVYITTDSHCFQEKRLKNDEISSDTIFTVVVTLSIFILGIAIDRFVKWLDKNSKKEKLKSYFEYHLIKVNEGLIPKLRDRYKKYYLFTDVDSGLTSTPPKVLSTDFERLLHIDNSELFYTFLDKEILSKVLSQIDFVSKIQSEVDNFHSLVLGQSKQLREEIKILSNEYISLLAEYAEMEKTNKGATYSLINDWVLLYYNELAGKRKLSDFYKKIIRPIQEYLIKSQLFRTNWKAMEIAEKGREISHLYYELRHQSIEVRIQYRVFSNYMNNTSNTLSELIIKLK